MYFFINDVMNVEISGKDLKVMMFYVVDLKNGMLYVLKMVKFKYYNIKLLGQCIVEFDIKGKQVVDKIFSIVVLIFLLVKVVVDLIL